MFKVKNFIRHIGIPRRSGRYPWGSGNDPQQRTGSLLGTIDELKTKGLSETEIAKGVGLSTTQLRNQKSIEKAAKRSSDVSEALRLQEKGLSNVAIGVRLGINESSVRSLLNPSIQARAEITTTISNALKTAVEDKKYIDVGLGVEAHMGVSRTRLDTAITMLKNDGYKLYYVDVEQLGTGKFTSMKVLASPETTYSELSQNRDKISVIGVHSEDGGRSVLGLKPIESISSNRIHIRYSEDGGSEKDGVIELRRGVDDLSLGNSKYAQVRIGVNGSHFLKGMAMYSDSIPEGKDVVYNTNKKKDVPPDRVFKEMLRKPDGSIDTDNPFGSTIQPGGQKRALNIVNEEGDWGTWSKSISSQILSKQPPSLAKKQLGLALDFKKEEFDEIQSLTNPMVKKTLLKSFSDEADSDAVNLKAAALPRQASYVLLPFSTLKENEIYAPKFNNGETVVLIRHPHGGIFEIPELVVNNKNPEANSLIKGAKDAVGIHPSVAAKLSGADFDGDTALVIPNSSRLIKTSESIKSLKDFDTKLSYPPYDGMPTIDGGIYNAQTHKVDYGGKLPRTQPKQLQMGEVSNLITDMTIKGASQDEIARAVKHSMVVIDSEKHHLNYKQSALDNNIQALKKKYQQKERGYGGASTLISKAGSEFRVPERKTRVITDPIGGQKIYENTGNSFVSRTGKLIVKTTKSTKMAETSNAFSLSSGTRMETIYAEHANALKDLANKARLSMLKIVPISYSPTAKATFASEVTSLKMKLEAAIRNKPLERQAQLIANTVYKEKVKNNPGMDSSGIKKIKGQSLIEARTRLNATKQKIVITPREWQAIQAGAISTNTLSNILLNTDMDKLKQMAMPRTITSMTSSKISRAKAMKAFGYTEAEIADALGVSVSTLSREIP